MVRAGHRELSLDHIALMEEVSLPVFLANVQGWPTVRGHIREYQARYRRAYADHHSYYQRESSRLWLDALGQLNWIADLGPPAGTGLGQRYNGLERGIRRCDVDLGDMPLQLSPWCPNCQMALGETPPAQELELFLRDLDHALGEQNRRLSLVLVERILHDRVDQRLENFLKIVQASDLAALSNTITDDLAQFIRQLLRSP